MPITLKDIAERANVSVSTVSKSLNNDKNVNEKTRRKIKKIAQELNYTTFGPGKALKKGKTNIISIIVPRIDNVYFSSLTQTIKNKLKDAGYYIILGSTNSLYEEEKKYVSLLKSGQVDGGIFAGNFNEELNADLFKNDIPIVNIGNINQLNPGIPVVKTNLQESTYKITSYLIKKGHKKIGFAGRDYRKSKGYQKALKEKKLDSKYRLYDDFADTFEAGLSLGKILHKTVPENLTALICSNDELALGVIQSFRKYYKNIAEKIAITGFDNTRMSLVASPSLTTVDIPKKKMGEKAAELILYMINHPDSFQNSNYEKKFVYPSKIIKRESTKFEIV